MKDDLMNKLMEEVMKKMSEVEDKGTVAAATGVCGLTELIGKAFGIVVGAPAGIGVLMADASLKAANVELVGYASPDNGGTKYSNESMIFITGDAGAVRQAVYAAREVGKQALEALGGPCPSVTTPYI